MNDPRIVVTLPEKVRNELKSVLASEGSNMSKWLREQALLKIKESQKNLAVANNLQ